MTALLTEAEAAEILKVTASTLKAWRTRGGGPPFVRVGRLARYQAQALQGWIDKQTVDATVPAKAKLRRAS